MKNPDGQPSGFFFVSGVAGAMH